MDWQYKLIERYLYIFLAPLFGPLVEEILDHVDSAEAIPWVHLVVQVRLVGPNVVQAATLADQVPGQVMRGRSRSIPEGYLWSRSPEHHLARSGQQR